MTAHAQTTLLPSIITSAGRTSGMLLQRKCSCGQQSSPAGGCAKCKERDKLQRSAATSDGPATVPPIVYEVLRSPGRPLDAATRAFMEPRFGKRFSDVRIHTGPTSEESAQAVHAQAFTVGKDIVFGPGQYAPHTKAGKSLLAHELTHTIQQGSGASLNAKSLEIGEPDSPAEIEANQVADAVTREIPRAVSVGNQSMPQIQRACGESVIGSVGGCVGLGGQDITDVGFSSAQLFRFQINCNDFLSGEESRIRKLAASVGLNDEIEIHGFASEEGPAEFNDELSCARAHRAANLLMAEGVRGTQISKLFKHGPIPGERVDRRSVVIDVIAPITANNQPITRQFEACFDGTVVHVYKNGQSHSCSAVTGNVGLPTDDGEYCIRRQGEAQLGRTLRHPFREHGDWYLLEPTFSTTRFRMHLHPGSNSAGCVSVTDDDCFAQIAAILNGPGTTSAEGYDGYPPGNSEGVTNPKQMVTCVGTLLVRRTAGACAFMATQNRNGGSNE